MDLLDTPLGSEVWEIGPGLGAITQLILQRGFHVTAFELDFGFSRVLSEEFSQEEYFRLVEGDARKTWKQVAADYGIPQAIIGNLPYRSASEILESLIQGGCHPGVILATLQKEGAQRIAARVGEKNYSSYSVIMQTHYQPEILGDIGGTAFFPEPEVTSSIIRLTRISGNAGEGDPLPAWYYRMVKAAFSSRRKTLQNNLRHWIARESDSMPGIDLPLIARAGSGMGITLNQRAETLSPEEYRRWAGNIQALAAG